MDSLYRKIGFPPYRLDQIQPLLDETSSLISSPEKPSAQFYNAAVETVESMEALALLVHFWLPFSFPQFFSAPRLTTDQLATLDSIGMTTLNLKGWLFDGFQPTQISRSAHGAAKLCQYCTWPFQRMARRPDSHLSDPRPLVTCFASTPSYLLAKDHWPNFPILGERSLQGCECCLFLREHLLSLVVAQPGKFGEEPVSVWIKFSWGTEPRSLDIVEVTVGSGWPLSGKSLYFTVDTTNGECPGMTAG